jgi:hypothetical protein
MITSTGNAMGKYAAILLIAASLASLPIQAEGTPACRKELIRYCISMYASWDVPPTLASCIAAMEPGPGITPAWFPLSGEIARGTIPPLARYRQCLEKSRAAIPRPTP